MSDRRLQVFSAVAHLLSFTRAAEVLHMTQPAVTFQIRQLEEYFNTRLFDRTHNRITLTEVGEKVYGYSSRIIDLYGEMDNEVRKLTGEVVGPLIIGASTTIAEYVIPNLLGEFQANFDTIKLRLFVSNSLKIIHMVENNDVDVGIVESPVENKNLVTKFCRQDELVLICAPDHPLASRAMITAQDLVEYPFIGREEGSGTRDVFLQYLQEHDMDFSSLNMTMEFGSPVSIKSAVAAGLGISVISIATLDRELERHALVKISLTPPITRPFSIIYQRQKFRIRVIEEFLDFTEEQCRKMVVENPPVA
ncbi:MAG TPA: LysR family transcriptional regulator [Gammaproteobacteria bacterium]|nr:LysR family transcriptional regulator [Gammaproteobacteria bacterium]